LKIQFLLEIDRLFTKKPRAIKTNSDGRLLGSQLTKSIGHTALHVVGHGHVIAEVVGRGKHLQIAFLQIPEAIDSFLQFFVHGLL